MTIITSCFSQNIKPENKQVEWLPIGAKWYYSRPYVDKNSLECIIFESIKDTLINDKNCREIFITNAANPESIISKEYIYQIGDSIFCYNYGNFYLLYNFSVKEGDTIIVHDKKFKGTEGFLYTDSIEHFKYKIVQIDSVNILDVWIKRQKNRSNRKRSVGVLFWKG